MQTNHFYIETTFKSGRKIFSSGYDQINDAVKCSLMIAKGNSGGERIRIVVAPVVLTTPFAA